MDERNCVSLHFSHFLDQRKVSLGVESGEMREFVCIRHVIDERFELGFVFHAGKCVLNQHLDADGLLLGGCISVDGFVVTF